MGVSTTDFVRGIQGESAFTVLAAARQLRAAGKDVIELEIGDSPFPAPAGARHAGIAAITAGHSHYGPSQGLPEFRRAAAEYVRREHGIEATADHILVGPGAKIFETIFCEAFLEPGDGVLVFSPYFPTYGPNIARRGARMVLSPLRESHAFRPSLDDVDRFLSTDPRPKAIFLNSPHNPTGGVATEADIRGLAERIRGRDVALFSDEPYDQMVWTGRHHSPLAVPGMFEQAVAAYTFSKSFSMSGWRLGFCVTSPAIVELLVRLVNVSLSCVPPFVQLAGLAAMQLDTAERDAAMAEFRDKVRDLARALREVPGVTCLEPHGTFYVFPNVKAICNRLGLTSHGLAMYLLEGADDRLGVACLGGECFGPGGEGFLRLSCAEPDERLQAAVRFLAAAVERPERVAGFLRARPGYALPLPYGD